MAKAPKTEKPNFSSFTKAELIRTIKTLSARETKHLNTIAKLQRVADDAAKLVAAFDGGGTIWLRDVDGTGSLHPCAKFDKGAVAFVRAPDLTGAAYVEAVVAAGSRIRLETLADMAKLDKALDAKGMHVPTGKVWGDDILNAGAAANKFPWEQG